MPDDTPNNTIGERVLHRMTVITTPNGEEIKDFTIPGGDLYKWGDAVVYAPKSPEFKFTAREQKRRDALDEFDDMERGI